MGWTSWQSKAAAGTADRSRTRRTCPGCWPGSGPTTGRRSGPTLSRPVIVQNTANAPGRWSRGSRTPASGWPNPRPGPGWRAGLAELHEIAARTELIDLVAIQVRTVPDDGAERAAWEHANRRPATPVVARQVNERLSRILTQAAVRHEAFVTVVVGEAADRPGRARRPAAGSTAAPGCCTGRWARSRTRLRGTGRLHRRHLAGLARAGGGDPHRLRAGRPGAPDRRRAGRPRRTRRWRPGCRWPRPARRPRTPRCGTTATTPGPASPTRSCCPTRAR